MNHAHRFSIRSGLVTSQFVQWKGDVEQYFPNLAPLLQKTSCSDTLRNAILDFGTGIIQGFFNPTKGNRFKKKDALNQQPNLEMQYKTHLACTSLVLVHGHNHFPLSQKRFKSLGSSRHDAATSRAIRHNAILAFPRNWQNGRVGSLVGYSHSVGSQRLQWSCVETNGLTKFKPFIVDSPLPHSACNTYIHSSYWLTI